MSFVESIVETRINRFRSSFPSSLQALQALQADNPLRRITLRIAVTGDAGYRDVRKSREISF